MKRAPAIYFDNNASTALAPAVLAVMHDCLAHCYANPSSMHRAGFEAKRRLSVARHQIATLLGAGAGEIVFTSGATEANQMAVLGALAAAPDKRHIVLSSVEHPSLLLLAQRLEADGVRVTRLAVEPDGRLDLARLEAALTPDTALLSLMWANNETGVLFPVAEAAALAQRRGALFHSDAVQAAGKVALDAGAVPFDLLSLSGHKLHAAKGVGALYIRKGVKLAPLLPGHQERGRRGGTENLAAIVGFGLAAELAGATLAADMAATGALRDRLEQGLLARLPQARVNGARGPGARLANTCNLRFGALDAEIVLDRLDQADLYASSGSACTAGGTAPSHVLLAMGLAAADALASVRFSLSRYTTPAEVERALELVPRIVAPLLGAPS